MGEKIRHRNLLVFFLICSITVLFGLIVEVQGIKTLLGNIEFIGIFVSAYLGTWFIVYRFFGKTSFQRATETELREEDDIFLQAIAFSQAALWIVLNLTPSNETIYLFKWAVPVIAISSYSIRAYAKLKNRNEWRYYSILIVSLAIGTSLSATAAILMGSTFRSLLVIDGKDITEALIFVPLGGVPTALFYALKNKIRIRYGC
jgi:cbb3-type cytochrome oxidase subunit 3